jgi:hypothetical protein
VLHLRLGQPEEALAAIDQAIIIQRKVTHGRFFPDLAGWLANQSVCLTQLQRQEEALVSIQEAVEINCELAAFQSDTFIPDLAATLRVLSEILASLGRQTEADTVRIEVDRLQDAETSPNASQV